MLGYANYVFTGIFACELILKVAGPAALCLRGLLLHMTQQSSVKCF